MGWLKTVLKQSIRGRSFFQLLLLLLLKLLNNCCQDLDFLNQEAELLRINSNWLLWWCLRCSLFWSRGTGMLNSCLDHLFHKKNYRAILLMPICCCKAPKVRSMLNQARELRLAPTWTMNEICKRGLKIMDALRFRILWCLNRSGPWEQIVKMKK